MDANAPTEAGSAHAGAHRTGMRQPMWLYLRRQIVHSTHHIAQETATWRVSMRRHIAMQPNARCPAGAPYCSGPTVYTTTALH